MKWKSFSSFTILVMLIIGVSIIASMKLGHTNGGNPPSIEFISWKVGQGDQNGRTFITDLQTTCTISACVGYSDEQSENIYYF